MSAEDDLKLLKKYARRCNQQNKLLQKLVVSISNAVLPPQLMESFDFDNVTDEMVEDFVARFTNNVKASDGQPPAIADVAIKDQRIKSLETTLASLDQLVDEKDDKIINLQRTINELQNQLDVLKAREEVNRSWSDEHIVVPKQLATRKNADSAPLRSINDLMNSGMTAPLLDVDVAGSVDDFMAMLEGVSSNGSLGRTSPREDATLTSPPDEDIAQPPSEISELFDALDFDNNLRKELEEREHEVALSVPSSREENEETMPSPTAPPIELLFDFSSHEANARHIEKLHDNNISEEAVVQDEVYDSAAPLMASSSGVDIQGDTPHFVLRPVVEPISLNPFDEDDNTGTIDGIQSEVNSNKLISQQNPTLQLAVAAAAPVTAFPKELDPVEAPADVSRDAATESSAENSRDKHRERFTSVASSDNGDAWAEFTERHLCPPHGLKSAVVDHLLQSWTSDQRKMQYLISWIECLASPLPSQFPPGLQIVRVSPVLRDGFLILLLPIIRHISMHEVTAFVRPSEAGRLSSNQEDDDDSVEDDLYDIRFQVSRSAVSNEVISSSGASTDEKKEASAAIRPDKAALQVNVGQAANVAGAKPVCSEIAPSAVHSEGVVSSASSISSVLQAIPTPLASFSSLLGPISSFWPLGGSAVSGNSAAVSVAAVSGYGVIKNGDDVASSLSEGKDNAHFSVAANNNATNSSKAEEPSVVAETKKGPPADRIAARLASLRNK